MRNAEGSPQTRPAHEWIAESHACRHMRGRRAVILARSWLSEGEHDVVKLKLDG